ncbi:MAG: lipid-A-disaccharide synthase, partial [Planctomycetota bacterium]
MARRIYISTGERSGEEHAAMLARALRERDPAVGLWGMGGARLSEAGVETIADASDHAITGFTEVFGHLHAFRALLRQAFEFVRTTRPDAVILVDYPGFHLRLARRIRKALPGQKIFYYIAPKFWAWDYRRVHELRRLTDRVLCILPFEEALLRAEGVSADFVGNPLLDELDFSEDGQTVRGELGLSRESSLVGLFPGSRKSEIRRILPILLAASRMLQKRDPSLCFVVAAAPGMDRAMLEALAGRGLEGLPVLPGRAHEIMAASRLLLAKSGTTTLEAALYGAPMVVLYRVSALSAWLGWRLVRTSCFSLPNLLAHDFPAAGENPRVLVPELIQEAATPERVAEEAWRILSDEAIRQTMRGKLLGLRERLGGPGASRRAAEA